MKTNKEPLADAESRLRIQDAIGRNLLVEAAAGTGKTTSLVDRMVALVGSGTSVERVCAVTFTIKAAAQLDQKFQNALEAAVRSEMDPERRGRFEEALAHLDACFIGTIHAFCSRLLRERPVEAGLDPGFEEMDEAADVAARGEAWGRYGERLFSEGSSVLARLLEAGMELETLRGSYDILSENGDVAAAAAPEGPPPDLSAVRPLVEAFLDAALPQIPQTVPRNGWDKMQAPIRAAGRMRKLLDLSITRDLIAVLRELDRATKPETASWPSRQAASRFSKEFEEFEAAVLAPALKRWREYLHPIAMSVVVPAAAEYAAWRRREGRLNFQDQLLFARNLLRDHPAVRRSLQERFTPVLVDEFQDTDPIQAEVLLYLTGAELEEKDWRRLHPLPGALFVVGDPKQSIYRFRRADIQTYDTVSRILEKSGGEVVRLSTNFRSTEALCGWANDVFRRIFPQERTESQAAHVELAPFRRDAPPAAAANAAPDDGAPVFRIDVPTSQRKIEMATADAERIADAIEAGLRGASPFGGVDRMSPSDFLILSRRRANLPVYARALEARGIPYEIAGGGAFRDSEEIATLLAAVEAIADPENPVPLVATLRGPLFGVDDESLYRFRQAGGHFDFRSSPPPRSDPRIRRAFGLLAEAAEDAASLPPAAALSRFVQRIGSAALAAARTLGDARAGNILKALASARELSRQRETFPEIVRRLRELTEDDKVEEMVTRPGRSDVVRLMTLHRAKGLEARVVFLADPSDSQDRSPNLWIDRSSEPACAHVLVERKPGGFSSPEEIARPRDWELKRDREREFLDRENERLLYVAATRAREALVVSFRRNKNGDVGGPWKRLDPHIARELPRTAAAARLAPALNRQSLAAELEQFRSLRRDRQSVSSRPSYAAATVTAIAHRPEKGDARPFASATGKGMSWGSSLHRILEAVMRDPALDLRAFAANVLAEEDRPPEDLDEALEAVEGVRGSPLWKRALASQRCLVEVPFSLSVPSADLGVDDGPAETLLSGAIDLVFEEDSGWVLVDYKSDTVRDNLDALVRFYEPQLAHYRRVWQETTGRPTRAGLFFLDGGREVWLNAADPPA